VVHAIDLIIQKGGKMKGKKREGLCSNCEHRETCTYPNARDNVLFCEEYE